MHTKKGFFIYIKILVKKERKFIKRKKSTEEPKRKGSHPGEHKIGTTNNQNTEPTNFHTSFDIRRML